MKRIAYFSHPQVEYMRQRVVGLCVAAFLVIGSRVQAQSLLTAPFGGTQATDILAVCPTGYCTSGPYGIGTNGYSVSFTGDVDPYLVGTGGTWGLADNGDWSGSFGYAGTNGAGSIIFSFGSPVASIGAWMNYAPGYSAPTLIAYDIFDVMVASFDLSVLAPITTPGGLDQSAFRGISYAGGISTFELRGGYLVTQDLYVSGEPLSTVPEPATMTLLATGLAGLSAARRKRRVT